MIRVYFLPVRTIDGTEQVAGIEFIHDALLECTGLPDMRKLIQDTTFEEHDALLLVAAENADATPDEIALYHAQVVITPPDPDIKRARELLASSPEVITQPEMWELMRIYGRHLGFLD